MSFPNYKIESLTPEANYSDWLHDQTDIQIENGEKNPASIVVYNEKPNTRVCLSSVEDVSVEPEDVIVSRTENSTIIIKPDSQAKITFVTTGTKIKHELVIVTRPLSKT